MTLHNAIGLYLSGIFGSSPFRISDRKVAFRDGRIQCIDLDSSTNSQTSVLISSQNSWKKLAVKPSGPGALPSLSWAMAFSTSCLEMGWSSFLLWSFVIIFGMCCVIEHMAFSLLPGGSLRISWKCSLNSFSISSCASNLSPCRLLMKAILFYILLWMFDLWKNLVFFSPSLSHWILDFCLHGISSCCLHSSMAVKRVCSCCACSSILPSRIMFCWSEHIRCSSCFRCSRMLPNWVWF